MTYTNHYNTRKTPQTMPIPGRTDMVPNSAGGFVFQLDPMAQFKRFLIIGCDGGTYYASGAKLTKENADNIVKIFQGEHSFEAVKLIEDVIQSGRAPKIEPALFALALACAFGTQMTKDMAYKAIPRCLKTGTQLFTFCQYIQDLRGWSRGLRRAVGKFYTDRTADKLGYQLMKYRQRNGWTHRDVLRLTHAKHSSPTQGLFRYAVGKDLKIERQNPKKGERKYNIVTVPEQFEAFLQLQETTSPHIAAQLILENSLPREAVPTELLKSREVWDALLVDMPMTALIRNLGVMTANQTLQSNFDDATKHVCEQLKNAELIKKSKVHPFAILQALKTYTAGHGFKGKLLRWTPIPNVAQALNEAFYIAFGNVTPTGKNTLLCLDVSGSMSSSMLANSNISAREAACAMAMVTAKVEPNNQIMAFSNRFIKLTLHLTARLEDLIHYTEHLPFESTDCSLPILFARAQKMPVDTFIVYTDNETFAGKMHASQALKRFRQDMGRDAKMIIVGMTSTGFTIADPTDRGMLDVVGFDTATPGLISDFMSQGF